MGLFAEVYCKYPLPDLSDAEWIAFQTKDLDAGSIFRPLPQYIITKEGKLTYYRGLRRVYPENSSPYYTNLNWHEYPERYPINYSVVERTDFVHLAFNTYIDIISSSHKYTIYFVDGYVGFIESIEEFRR